MIFVSRCSDWGTWKWVGGEGRYNLALGFGEVMDEEGDLAETDGLGHFVFLF